MSLWFSLSLSSLMLYLDRVYLLSFLPLASMNEKFCWTFLKSPLPLFLLSILSWKLSIYSTTKSPSSALYRPWPSAPLPALKLDVSLELNPLTLASDFEAACPKNCFGLPSFEACFNSRLFTLGTIFLLFKERELVLGGFMLLFIWAMDGGYATLAWFSIMVSVLLGCFFADRLSPISSISFFFISSSRLFLETLTVWVI